MEMKNFFSAYSRQHCCVARFIVNTAYNNLNEILVLLPPPMLLLMLMMIMMGI
jgi:hypothetical protein